MACWFRVLLCRVNSFQVELVYFVSVSFLGFGFLKALKPKTYPSFKPRDLDFFFTSVSATTVSSMSTVEMEVFSNSQLIVLTVLMFIGGEVFTSMAGLFLSRFRAKMLPNVEEKVASVLSSRSSSTNNDIELGEVSVTVTARGTNNSVSANPESENMSFPCRKNMWSSDVRDPNLVYNSKKLLSYVVLGYLMVVQTAGTALVYVYMAVVSSARDVLRNKNLNLLTFSAFTTVSTFVNCGFIPTNENMMVFSKNSGLLLILIPQALVGNTLFPPCLRVFTWLVGKLAVKSPKSRYYVDFLLENTKEIGYLHLFPSRQSWFLVETMVGLVVIQWAMLVVMEWSSAAFGGLNSYQKIIGGIFQSVNSRHSGETIMDISVISPAILVLFVVTMYLPPYFSFFPVKKEEEKNQEKRRKRKGKIVKNLIFSQLSYLVIFIILICITEREKIKKDPLNFNVFNITLEVISAYGNVGFTAGYSCKRRLNPDGYCEDKWYGFAGRWSDDGKIILILVMIFGRLKKFNMNGGKAWRNLS